MKTNKRFLTVAWLAMISLCVIPALGSMHYAYQRELTLIRDEMELHDRKQLSQVDFMSRFLENYLEPV